MEELCSDVVILKEGKLIHSSSMEFLIDQSKEIVIRGKDIESISKPLRESNSFQIKSVDKEKLIIKTELDIQSINQLLPKNF